MPKHQAYPAAFREQLVALVHAGRSPAALAKEFEPTAQTIRNWMAQSERDRGTRTDGLTTAEQREVREVRELRRQVRQLTLERDILSKAAAWFARETGTIPKTSSEDSRS